MIETGGRNRDINEIHKLNLWSPLFFVQVWAWERMVSLQPECPRNYNIVSGVRIGRWHNAKQTGETNLRTTIDASGEIFCGGHTPWLWKVGQFFPSFTRKMKSGQ
uniref:Aminotransferase-like plant mobile domain-containing protein n=2 Tax=Solanum lycopersicum TaxID=4081 RepID=A0A3Q7HFF4_SOLLC